MRSYNFLLLGALLVLFSACIKNADPLVTNGLKPIYVKPEEATHIYAMGPQNIEISGKIYAKAPFIYINEQGRGVHVIDNSTPSNPQRVAFIHIPGNHDIAIKGNYLYADNMTDLVTLDISDLQQVEEVSRVKNLYSITETLYPLNYNGYFECADTTKGLIISWEKAVLENPKCRR